MQSRRDRPESYLNESPERSDRRKPAHAADYGQVWGNRMTANASDVSESDDGHHRGDYAFERELYSSEAMLPQAQHLPVSVRAYQPRISLAQIIDAYTRRCNYVADIRFDNASQRMDAEYHWAGFQQDLKSLQESVGCLSARSTNSKSQDANKKSKTRLKKLHARMQVDLASLNTKSQAVVKFMSELKARDKRIERAEQALDNACRALISAAAQRSDLADAWPYDERGDYLTTSLAPTPQSGSEVSATVSTEIAPELAEFYSAVSNYKIMRERLFDLDVERQEQWERRLLLADQDQLPDETDEEFAADWKETFVVPEQDFQNARTALQKAQKSCIDVGIVLPSLEDLQIPNTEGYQESSELTSTDPPRIAMISQLGMTAGAPSPTFVQVKPQRKLFGESLVAHGSSPSPGSEPQDLLEDSSPATPAVINGKATERISQWMENVDLGAVNQSLAKYSLSSSGGPSSAFATLTNDHRGKARGNESHDSSARPNVMDFGRKRASSLPPKLETGPQIHAHLTNGGSRSIFKPP